MNKLKLPLYFIVIYAAMCFLSLNRHSHARAYTYHSEIWADKAGYNVYLPLVFIYQHSAFPDSLVPKTGYGFEIDSTSRKVITKYPYGVSLLQSPFWLMAHALAPDKSGYSAYYQKSIDFAGCFYLTLGLFFLFFTLRDFKPWVTSLLLTLAIALSTGIFYYGIFETGMSHIYSFCCLSVIIFLFFKANNASAFSKLFWLAVTTAVFVIIRPVNTIFIVPTLFFFLYSGKTLSFASIRSLNFIQFVVIACSAFLIILPQLLYYDYAFGNFLSNSYHKEPFFLPTVTRIGTMLFSPDNGLFVYYPVIIGLVVFSFVSRSVYTKLLLPLLIIYILLYASWWSLSLGCSFGHRAMNDIVILFFLPVCFSTKKTPLLLSLLFVIFILINLKFIFSYDGCLYQSDKWDFTEYSSVIFGEFK